MVCQVPAEALPPSMPPHIAALCSFPRSAVWIVPHFILPVLGVISFFLSLAAVGKVHVHIAWEDRQLDKVKELSSATLSDPSIQPTLQREPYTQDALLRSMGSASRQAATLSKRGFCMHMCMCLSACLSVSVFVSCCVLCLCLVLRVCACSLLV